MRTLSSTETPMISAASFDYNGCLVTVPSTGIPTKYYLILDDIFADLVNEKIELDEAAMLVFKYDVPEQYFFQYIDNLAYLTIECTLN